VGLFLPGWGAPPALYRAGLPPGWIALDPPDFDRSHFSFGRYRDWALGELQCFEGPCVIGGHSMGGAMAICVAATRPELVARLVLVSPAGLPLTKPISRSLADFTLQLVGGRYPIGRALDGIRDALSAPRAALSVARSVHDLDLSSEMRAVRDQGVSSAVIGCSSDSLVTAAHCQRAALLLGATYRELALAGGHMWMLRNWSLFRDELAAG
jgi:pimeloyl-ACP methyl ester carboxylesterase